MTIVVDASVVLKWVIEEHDSDRARDLAISESLVAPDLLYVECANVLWTKARRKLISPSQAAGAFGAIEATPIRLTPTRHHTAAALALALKLDQTAYDCLYLAVAIDERAVLVTADEAFARAAHAHDDFRQAVRLLNS